MELPEERIALENQFRAEHFLVIYNSSSTLFRQLKKELCQFGR